MKGRFNDGNERQKQKLFVLKRVRKRKLEEYGKPKFTHRKVREYVVFT